MNTNQQLPKSTDVLIVGAGPTGMTLAVSLQQLGVDCVVIDQLPDAPDDTRAAFVQPRTLEYLHRIHVAGPMIDDGLRGRGAAFADLERDLFRLSYDTVDSPYPFLLMIPQSHTQRHLDQRFAELGGSVLRGVRLLDLVPEYPGSAASVVDSTGALRVINARFVAGCDGVWSRVRNQLGIGFPGSSPEQMFAVSDVRFEGWPADRMETAFSLSPHGMLISSPLPKGMARVVASVAPGTPTPTLQDVNDLIQTRGPSWMRNGNVTELLSSSTWHVHERLATQFRHGNTFLLGDAAHTHSPAGGQGMNTGIQDAGNLAWKLHHVLSLGVPESLLDSYEAERRPNAQRLLEFTHQIVNWPCSPARRSDRCATTSPRRLVRCPVSPRLCLFSFPRSQSATAIAVNPLRQGDGSIPTPSTPTTSRGRCSPQAQRRRICPLDSKSLFPRIFHNPLRCGLTASWQAQH
jgi:2-polyprenyl-6-methoxyphenol hydroxylase-like FAD-dependent oxidoreductase